MNEQYIRELSKEMELEAALRSDVPGVWAMPIEEDLSIMISSVPPQGFALNCGFAPCPTHNLEQFYERMLLGNLFGEGTDGAVLGLNEDGSQLTLEKTQAYCADYKEFRDILEDFVNTVDYWLEETASWK